MNVKTKFNWRIIYILIPLLPFLLGGFIRTGIIMTSPDFIFNGYTVLKTLYFSWDAVALSFSISVIAFVVKNNLTEKPLPLPNEDRKKDLADNSSKLFLWGFVNLVFFAILLYAHTQYKELHKFDVRNTHILFSLIIYFTCFFTMRDVLRIQNSYNLTAKFL